MVDVTSSLAPYMYEIMQNERNAWAYRRRWNVRLRELIAAERDRAARALTRRTTVRPPSTDR